MPIANPANTSKLFQENPRNELGLGWIFINMEMKVELGFSRNSNFIFSAGTHRGASDFLPQQKRRQTNLGHSKVRA